MEQTDEKNDCSPPKSKKQCVRKTDLATNDHWRRYPDKFHLLIGCTGSVASIKIPEIITNINLEIKKSCKQYEDKISIKIIATENALKFFDEEEIDCPVYTDNDEWTTWKNRGDPIVHIELRLVHRLWLEDDFSIFNRLVLFTTSCNSFSHCLRLLLGSNNKNHIKNFN